MATHPSFDCPGVTGGCPNGAVVGSSQLSSMQSCSINLRSFFLRLWPQELQFEVCADEVLPAHVAVEFAVFHHEEV